MSGIKVAPTQKEIDHLSDRLAENHALVLKRTKEAMAKPSPNILNSGLALGEAMFLPEELCSGLAAIEGCAQGLEIEGFASAAEVVRATKSRLLIGIRELIAEEA